MSDETIKLTQYTQGGGCGCKIAPQVLDEILKNNSLGAEFQSLLVGNKGKDDAAVYQLNETEAIISTTDFFTPIVDEPFTFGKVAAANAISDVYAMGGEPILGLAILGWPINKLPLSAAQEMLEGAREICKEVGIPIAGGHSIVAPEPIFGLSVNGKVSISNLKQNSKAQEGDLLFLTKPIGIGVLSTAEKRGKISESDRITFIEMLTKVNKIGKELGKLKAVNAMTDVTGFGIGGHLIELCEASNLSADLYFDKIPKLNGVVDYLKQNIIPDATYRNWNGFGNKIKMGAELNTVEAFQLLPDPQTNGGLLFSVLPTQVDEVIAVLKQNGYENHIEPIGEIKKKDEFCVYCK